MDGCAENACQNGATCMNAGPDYTCACPPGTVSADNLSFKATKIY